MTGNTTSEFWLSRLDELKRVVALKWASSKIGGHFGVSRNAVVGICKRQGITLQGGRIGWGGAPPPQRKRNRQAPRAATPTSVIALPTPKPVTEPTCRPVMLMKLKPRSCRWPVKEETGVKQLFCGATHEVGVPYCAFHEKISRGQSKPEWTPERRAKFLKSAGIGGLAAP